MFEIQAALKQTLMHLDTHVKLTVIPGLKALNLVFFVSVFVRTSLKWAWLRWKTTTGGLFGHYLILHPNLKQTFSSTIVLQNLVRTIGGTNSQVKCL